jgi:hypothetical protein
MSAVKGGPVDPDKFDADKYSEWRRLVENTSRVKIPDVSFSIKRIEDADPANVQQIAASQLELLTHFYHLVLAQSRRSFWWAIVGSGIGLVFFIAAVGFALTTGVALSAAVISGLAGAIVEGVAGIVFWLYGRTTTQLSSFHSRLDVLQRYLLANSICERLDGEDKNKARAELVREISRPQPAAEKSA